MSEPQSAQASTHIESTIDVTTVEQAGKVVGIEVGNLQVDLFSSAPGRGPVKPECVRAYLESVKKRSGPAEGAKPRCSVCGSRPFARIWPAQKMDRTYTMP